MNKIDDEYIDTLNIISKQYADRICDGEKKSQIIKEQLLCIEDLQNSKNNLIKYLENKIYSIQPKGCDINFFPENGYDSEEDMIRANVEYNLLKSYKDILEKVRRGNYE